VVGVLERTDRPGRPERLGRRQVEVRRRLGLGHVVAQRTTANGRQPHSLEVRLDPRVDELEATATRPAARPRRAVDDARDDLLPMA
jgi:hypothetical protein